MIQKERDHFTNGPSWVRSTKNNNTGLTTVTTYPIVIGYYAGYKDLTIAPFDKTKFRPGVFKITDITRQRYTLTYEPDPGSTQAIGGGYKWTWVISGNYLPCAVQEMNLYTGSPVPVTPWDTTKENIVLLSAASKVSAPDLDGALFLAEIGDTLRMLRKPLTLFTGGYKQFQKLPRALRNAKPTRVANYLSSKWLEYRYGIMPLINDVDTAMQLLVHRELQYYSRIRYKSDRIRASTGPTLETTTTTRPLLDLWLNWSRWSEESSAYVGRVYYKMTDNSYVHRSMAEMLGFNSNSLLPLLWELVPYSFCVDWVFSVGDWLKAHQPKPDINQFAMTVSLRRQLKRTWYKNWFTCVDPGARPEWIAYKKTRVLTSTLDHYSRSRRYQLPAYPQVRWDLYGIKQSIDSLSLLWQQNTKRR